MTNFIDKLKKANEVTECVNCKKPVFGRESHCKYCGQPNQNYVKMDMDSKDLNDKNTRRNVG